MMHIFRRKGVDDPADIICESIKVQHEKTTFHIVDESGKDYALIHKGKIDFCEGER